MVEQNDYSFWIKFFFFFLNQLYLKEPFFQLNYKTHLYSRNKSINYSLILSVTPVFYSAFSAQHSSFFY